MARGVPGGRTGLVVGPYRFQRPGPSLPCMLGGLQTISLHRLPDYHGGSTWLRLLPGLFPFELIIKQNSSPGIYEHTY